MKGEGCHHWNLIDGFCENDWSHLHVRTGQGKKWSGIQYRTGMAEWHYTRARSRSACNWRRSALAKMVNPPKNTQLVNKLFSGLRASIQFYKGVDEEYHQTLIITILIRTNRSRRQEMVDIELHNWHVFRSGIAVIGKKAIRSRCAPNTN